MTMTLLRHGLLAVGFGLLLSCGGGGSSGSASLSVGGGQGSVAVQSGNGANAGLLAGDASPGGDSGGPSGGGAGGAGGGTTTASGGDEGSGVGSGGTGVSTADATGVGAVDGAGSIIVNGLRYATRGVNVNVEDAPALQLGMSAKVTGPVNADFTLGVAHQIESAAEIRGPVSSVDLAQGRLAILGTTVTTDESTVWADSAGLAALAPGMTLQVWGLPAGPGVLLATRVEQRGPSTPILSGTVQGLDIGRRTFMLGGMLIDYSLASMAGPLVNGALVRVRADVMLPNRLPAKLVQGWYPTPTADAALLQLAGVVTDFTGIASFRVLGVQVDASAADLAPVLASALGNGVQVEVAGVMANGVLKATKLRLRHVPGTGGPASFSLHGLVSNFDSASNFRVRGQPVDASGAGVVFVNGSASALGNGVGITVEGARVVNGVLIATRVRFD
ncbi:DUF5666 domain-containing protein [Variovorax sp. LARHSF232]